MVMAPKNPSDLLLALVVSKDSPAAERTTETTKILTSLENLTLEAVWHTPTISEGEPLTLLSGVQALSQGPDWVFGAIPPIHRAPATQESLHQGQTLDLTREEALERFRRVSLSENRQSALIEAVKLRNQELDSGNPPSSDTVQRMITELRSLLGMSKIAVEIDEISIETLSLMLSLFDDTYPELRDIALWEIIERPGIGGPLTLAAAQHATSDETRANALCAYFLSAYRAGATSRASLALGAAQKTAPDHFLTRLLSVAHSRGETDEILRIIKQEVDVSRTKYGIE